MSLQKYLNEEMEYGGELWPRGKVILDLKRKGATRKQIDMYLIGAEKRKQIQEAECLRS